MQQVDFDLCRSSWVGDYADANTFLNMFVTGDGNNDTGWSNASYDKLIASRAKSLSSDTEKRADIFRKAETMLVDDEAPICPLYFYVGIQFYDDNKIGGIQPSVLDEHPLNDILPERSLMDLHSHHRRPGDHQRLHRLRNNRRCLPARRILIRSSNWLGDAVMTSPAVRAIKLTRPDAHITILTRAKLVDFWKIVPEVDAVISCNPNENVFSVAKKSARATSTDSGGDLPEFHLAARHSKFTSPKSPAAPAHMGKSPPLASDLDFLRQGRNRGHPGTQMHHYLDLVEFAGAKVDESMGGHRDCPAHHAASRCPVRKCNPAAGENRDLSRRRNTGAAKRWLPDAFR